MSKTKMRHATCAALLAMMPALGALPAPAGGGGFAANRTDFRDESIYFVITTRFYDGDPGNNVLCWDNQANQTGTRDPAWRGDFRGLIDKLDYIKALGFTAIWITPIAQNASGYDYHGYHASDFTKVDCRYQGVDRDAGKTGDEMFQELIDAAHAKGMKIILDIVLNHTGNFGEETLCKEFGRDTDIRNQADINSCMTPTTMMPAGYASLEPAAQYQSRLAMMKNTDGQNHDTNNYWHHYAEFNWDEPNRWWAQIAGDCVDLNTENPAVDEYLVRCYTKYIDMGVDGFRIDTSGHIAPMTLNAAFVPQFKAAGEAAAQKRLLAGQAAATPFYMYGEVCARYQGTVVYRGQPMLSPYYYTWASGDASLSSWRQYDASWWARQVVAAGAKELGNMSVCLNDDTDKPRSNNAWLQDHAYHTPDYSQSSGFNVIDFPVHYSFNNVGSVYGLTDMDNYYNDATWNVVYVDSHDYAPGSNDGYRFQGGTSQWAENLTWMFLFRGIPCLYYGSEVEFQKGQVIDKGTEVALNTTGRAYFGQNLEGTVTATDFGQFTATGQVAKTLNHPLAKHLERLNRIRQAVPALRKGQYEKQPTSTGWAWKKAYNANGENSFACVAQQTGTVTFTNIPDGTYTDCVTGDAQTVSGGSMTVSCPTNQGNCRVYVLNGPGKIGDDGPFIYASSASACDSSELPADPGATKWIGPEDAVGAAGLSFSPAGSSFTTETLTVSVSPVNCTSGWYSVNGGTRVSVSGSTSFTIGGGDEAGTTYTVAWGATLNDGTEKTGVVTYKKVGVYTPVVAADEKSVFYETTKTSVAIWVWNDNANFTGGVWDHKPNMEYMGINAAGRNIFKWTYDGSESSMPTKVIFVPAGENQSGDLDYKNHGYYIDNVWDHEVASAPTAISVSLEPGTSSFTSSVSVTATVSNATGVYTTDGTDPTASSPTFTGSKTFTFSETTTLKVGALKDGGVTNIKTAIYTKKTEVDKLHAYFINNNGWATVMAWVWQNSNANNNYTGGSWPGASCTKLDLKGDNGEEIWEWIYDGTNDAVSNLMIIFNNGGNGSQTANLTFTNGGWYNASGSTTVPSTFTAISIVSADKAAGRCVVYNMQGEKVAEVGSLAGVQYVLRTGVYIANGRKFVIR